MGSPYAPGLMPWTACAADGVIHTAFRHDGSVPYPEACKIDCAAIKAMTDAMAGTNKPFVMSSGTGVIGETGPHPVTEEFPIDPEHALAMRVSTERVGLSAFLLCNAGASDMCMSSWQSSDVWPGAGLGSDSSRLLFQPFGTEYDTSAASAHLRN